MKRGERRDLPELTPEEREIENQHKALEQQKRGKNPGRRGGMGKDVTPPIRGVDRVAEPDEHPPE